jgi:hypothetical protein
VRYGEAADQRANQFVDIVHTHTLWIGSFGPYTYLGILKCMGIIYSHQIGVHKLGLYNCTQDNGTGFDRDKEARLVYRLEISHEHRQQTFKDQQYFH